MKKLTVKHHIDSLVALLLFAVFAVCILTVLLTGAGVYQRLTQRDQGAYQQRTCLQYIAQRVRQADGQGGVGAGRFNGMDALELRDEEGYITRVYCYDGWLMELYCAEDLMLEPEDGERVMEAEGMELSIDNGGVRVKIEGCPDLYLTLRGEMEGGLS